MSPFEIVLAGTIVFAVLVQILILINIYRALARFSATADRLIQTVEPQLREVSSGMQQIRSTVEAWNPDVRATLASIRATTETLGSLAQKEGREIAQVVERSTALAQKQLAETDRALDQTRQRVGEVLEGFDRNVLEPVRLLLALASGIRRGVERLIHVQSERDAS